ncbi:Smaug homolog 2, partial [Pelobates cultripes]
LLSLSRYSARLLSVSLVTLRACCLSLSLLCAPAVCLSRYSARLLSVSLVTLRACCLSLSLLGAPAVCLSPLISQWHQESKETVISLLLTHLPLLQPRNTDAKCEYMKLLQKVLAYTTESNSYIEESRQLLSYALIHPATTLDDRNSLALWLNHLEERLSTGYSRHGRADAPHTHMRQGSDEWQTTADSGIGEAVHGWQDKPLRENGLLPFHSSSSVPSAIQSVGSSTDAREMQFRAPIEQFFDFKPYPRAAVDCHGEIKQTVQKCVGRPYGRELSIVLLVM